MKTIGEVIKLMNGYFSNRTVDWSEMQEFARKYNLKFAHGETRFCLYDPKWDRVLKIPRFENVSDDYSEIEANNYQKAKYAGLADIFLASEYYCTLDCDLPIYVQVKYTYSHCGMNHCDMRAEGKKIANAKNAKIYKRVRNSMPDDRCYDDVWLCRAYQLYGKQFFRKLCEFLRENAIDDLHASNVGWLNGKPVILDYAGYHENDW